jgi:predicted Rossmann fold flavoprotein
LKTVLIAGAGAAGLMAAAFAAGRGWRVVVIDGTTDGGRKILISGGGRCNVLPQALEPDRFVTDSSPALLRRLLRSWPLDEQRAFFERDLGIPLALESESRKYFPASNRARDVRDGLVAFVRARDVEVVFGAKLEDLAADPASASGWIAHTSQGAILADRVILATGGRSVPATGSDGAGLEIAARIGHRVHPTYPALTPLVADPPIHVSLSGVSLPVRLRARSRAHEHEAHGGFLFTHRGYSGPSVLDVSHVAVRSRMAGSDRAKVLVRWSVLDANAWTTALREASGRVANVVSRHVPARLAERLLVEAGVPLDRQAAELRRAERTGLVDRLTAYELPWTGDEGYAKAEVTGGGVALGEVHAATLESRVKPGLFLCGELLDAFGPIGGHNFAWAWATGRLAGLGATS